VRRRSDGTIAALNYGRLIISSMEMGMPASVKDNTFICKGIISSIKTVPSVSETMAYIVLRDSWCDTIVVNVPTGTEDKSNYKDCRQMSMKDIFKLITGNDSLHEGCYSSRHCHNQESK
jgi:hypothetical protein